MGKRKRYSAELRKEIKKNLVFAKLKYFPGSPRKMRLLADKIRGKRIEDALLFLKYAKKAYATPLRKLLLSAINNWEQKYEDIRVEDAQLYISEIYVDGAGMLKRIRPAPMGRAHLIRKRRCHVTIFLDALNKEKLISSTKEVAETEENKNNA